MRPGKLTQGEAGTSAWFPLDYHQAPFRVSMGVDPGGGTLTFDIEYTLVDVNRETPAAGEVFKKSEDNSGAAEATFEFPVAAVRLNVTDYTDGQATARILQAGMGA